jgi:uncharacterized protein
MSGSKNREGVEMKLSKAFLGVAAVGVAAFAPLQASAQQAGDEPTLVAGTIDCRYQLRPVDTTICTTPILAAMDLQMITLFNVLNHLVKPEVGVEMAATQEAFMKTRAACSTDVDCIGQTTARRISELDVILKDIASRGPY